MKRILIGIAAFFGLLIVGAGLFLAFFDWNSLREEIAGRAGAASGRSIAIDGDLDVHLLSLTPRIRAQGVRMANAEWGSEPQMVQIGLIDLTIRLPPLLQGKLVIPQLRLERPRLLFEKGPQGEANWKLRDRPAAAAATEAASPDERSELPVIERVVVEQGAVTYRDQAGGIDITMQVSTAAGTGQENDNVRVQGQGSVAGEPFALDLLGGSLLTLREEKVAYPIRFQAAVGATRATIEGTVDNPLAMDGLDLRMAASGRDLAALFPIVGVPLPATPAYSLAGRLIRRGGSWSVRDLKGRVGNSDLDGDAFLITDNEPPRFEAVLTSKNLDYHDLGGFIGARPDRPKPPGRVLPDNQIQLERLHAMDMSVRFTGQRIIAPNLPLDNLTAQFELRQGRLAVRPLSVGVAGGRIEGDVVIDGRRAIPSLGADLQLSRLSLPRFFTNPQLAQQSRGTIGGHIELTGTGRSTAEVLANSNGRISAVMAGGSLSNLVLEVAGIDIAESLGFLLTEDKAVQVRCAVADFSVEQGVMSADTLVVDTADTAVTGEGVIDLRNEGMRLRLAAHPKDSSVLAARAPVLIDGTFADPEFGVDPTALAARGGIAAGLAAVLGPLAALIPFIELGLGEDTPCDQLIQQARH